ncbi:MAG: hypothetical protein WCK31_00375 [bacterium]
MLINKVDKIEVGSFVKDLQAFIPINQRDKLPELLAFIKALIKVKVS